MEIRRAKTYRGEALRAYSCNRCGNVHTTSMTRKAFNKMIGRD